MVLRRRDGSIRDVGFLLDTSFGLALVTGE